MTTMTMPITSVDAQAQTYWRSSECLGKFSRFGIAARLTAIRLTKIFQHSVVAGVYARMRLCMCFVRATHVFVFGCCYRRYCYCRWMHPKTFTMSVYCIPMAGCLSAFYFLNYFVPFFLSFFVVFLSLSLSLPLVFILRIVCSLL